MFPRESFGDGRLGPKAGDVWQVEAVCLARQPVGRPGSQTLASGCPHDEPGTPSPLQLDLTH